MSQYDKQHATTVVATAALEAQRFISHAGIYAVGTAGAGGGVTDSAGVSETEAVIGDALSVVTGYSYPVEAGAAITQYAFVKPGTNGKAIAGTMEDHCGIALEAAAADGDIIEVRLLPHIHPTS